MKTHIRLRGYNINNSFNRGNQKDLTLKTLCETTVKNQGDKGSYFPKPPAYTIPPVYKSTSKTKTRTKTIK